MIPIPLKYHPPARYACMLLGTGAIAAHCNLGKNKPCYWTRIPTRHQKPILELAAARGVPLTAQHIIEGGWLPANLKRPRSKRSAP